MYETLDGTYEIDIVDEKKVTSPYTYTLHVILVMY